MPSFSSDAFARIAHRLAASDKADAETGVLAGKLGQRSAEEYILAEGVGVISGAYGAGNIYAYLACLRGQCHCGLSASRAAQHEPVSRNGECSRYSEYRLSAVRTAVGYCCLLSDSVSLIFDRAPEGAPFSMLRLDDM